MSAFEIAASLIEMAINLVGKDTVRELIDPETVKRADTIADAAELVKFGKVSDK